MRSFYDLLVWQKSHQLTLACYRAIQSFPRDERFELTSQLRRAASAIPANIAEGCGKESNPEFLRYLQIAAGSATELEYHLLLARDLGHLKADAHRILHLMVVEVKRMLMGLSRRIESELVSQKKR